jgi:hypothetical protein
MASQVAHTRQRWREQLVVRVGTVEELDRRVRGFGRVEQPRVASR